MEWDSPLSGHPQSWFFFLISWHSAISINNYVAVGVVVVSLVGASPDYSASFEEFLAKFGKGYTDSQEHVGLGRNTRTAKSM